jgi:hypothetical protein
LPRPCTHSAGPRLVLSDAAELSGLTGGDEPTSGAESTLAGAPRKVHVGARDATSALSAHVRRRPTGGWSGSVAWQETIPAHPTSTMTVSPRPFARGGELGSNATGFGCGRPLQLVGGACVGHAVHGDAERGLEAGDRVERAAVVAARDRVGGQAAEGDEGLLDRPGFIEPSHAHSSLGSAQAWPMTRSTLTPRP